MIFAKGKSTKKSQKSVLFEGLGKGKFWNYKSLAAKVL
jgi:hypothetical protein